MNLVNGNSISNINFQEIIPGLKIAKLNQAYNDDVFIELGKKFQSIMLGYSDESGGQIIQDVKAVRGKENTYSSKGSNDFPFHTEAPHRVDSPDSFILICLKAGNKAKTKFVSVPEIEYLLPTKILTRLREYSYPISVGSNWDNGGRIVQTKIARGVGEWAYHSGNMSPSTINDCYDILCIEEAISRCDIVEIELEAGDIAWVSNKSILHARTSFVPTFEANDRHLKRCYYREI